MTKNNTAILINAATTICKKIADNGGRALFVGGCVRDQIVGHDIKDIDIATDLHPNKVKILFPGSKLVGESFGVVIVRQGKIDFEVTTFRKDGQYIDLRRPESVEFGTMQDDILRRDFTINAIYKDPVSNEIIDLVGGRDDLQNKILRCVGKPEERFQEDALRLLRAVRFAARLGLSFDPDTRKAIIKYAENIKKIAPERIKDEITKMIVHKNGSLAIKMMFDLGLLEIVLPEVYFLIGVKQPEEWHPEGDCFIHTQKSLAALDNRNPITAWAILLHDIGKALTYTIQDGKIHFNGHDEVGVKIATEILHQFRFSNEDSELILRSIGNHMRFHKIKDMRQSKVRRLLGIPGIENDLAVHKADCKGSIKDMSTVVFAEAEIKRFKESPERAILPKPYVNGHDLMELGMSPGPELGSVLRKIHDAQLDDAVISREEALKLAAILV